MKRWHALALVLLAIVMGGCDIYPPPFCYTPVLSVENPADLTGFSIQQLDESVMIRRTTAPATTFILSSKYYAFPVIQTSPHQPPAGDWFLIIRSGDINRTRNINGPRYPDCGTAFTETYTVPMMVIQGEQRKEVGIRVVYVPNTDDIARYEEYLRESAAKQRRIDRIGAIFAAVIVIGVLGIIALMVWAVGKLLYP
jgi:tetrahydromethanopterin S-methyltransferase subunit F